MTCKYYDCSKVDDVDATVDVAWRYHDDEARKKEEEKKTSTLQQVGKPRP